VDGCRRRIRAGAAVELLSGEERREQRWPTGMWTRPGARVIPWAGPSVAAFVG